MRKPTNVPKFKHSCIKPECVDQDMLYTFSFNPQEQPLIENFYRVTLTRFQSWSETMDSKLKRMRHCTYKLVLEISTGGRLHYHGWISINNIMGFYLMDLKYLADLGTYEIDNINDFQKWDTYVYKQRSFVEPWTQMEDMKYSITNDKLIDTSK